MRMPCSLTPVKCAEARRHSAVGCNVRFSFPKPVDLLYNKDVAVKP